MFTIRDPQKFERSVLSAVGAGLAVGVAALLIGGRPMGVPPWLIAGPAVLVSVPGHSIARRGTLLLLCLDILLVLFTLRIDPVARVAVFGAALAMGISFPRERVSGIQFALVTASGAALLLLGDAVTASLWEKLQWLGFPGAVAHVLLVGVSALFLSLCTLPLEVVPRPDPILAAAEGALSSLQDRPHALATRALSLYREIDARLKARPRDAQTGQLRASLRAFASATFQHLSAFHLLGSEEAAAELDRFTAEAQRLRAELETTSDPVARGHLQQAIAAFELEAQRATELHQARTRAIARLEAQVALLQQTRSALLSAQTGHAELQSAELTRLAKSLASVGSTHALEAEAMRAVAKDVELESLSDALTK